MHSPRLRGSAGTPLSRSLHAPHKSRSRHTDTPPLGTRRPPLPAVSIHRSTVPEICPHSPRASGPRRSTPPVSASRVALLPLPPASSLHWRDPPLALSPLPS